MMEIIRQVTAMTNREKLTKTNIYDLLCTIQKALLEDDGKISGLCVIEDIERKPRSCPEGSPCGMCIANWLNTEAEPPEPPSVKPQWHDAMMKNFLRKE